MLSKEKKSLRCLSQEGGPFHDFAISLPCKTKDNLLFYKAMKRAHEALLHEYLSYFPCVALVGPRQCGKTTLLGVLPQDWQIYDIERSSDHEVIARDPDQFLRLNPTAVAIDEVQLLPSLFPALRVAIDQQRDQRGHNVITGSSSPALVRSIAELLN